MLRPEKLAIPEDALSVVVPESVPLAGFVERVRAIAAVLPSTVFPKSSWTVMTGC